MNAFSSAGSMLVALRDRRLSAIELLELHLERIRRFNSTLNAFVTLDVEGARTAALEADRNLSAGGSALLLGLPLTIKDAIDTAGLPTTSGLRRRRESIPASDAPLVRRLRAAGAVILGKTNVPPYAGDWQTDNPLFGRTNNPWDLGRTPGGSTGGGAAAMAAGLSPLEYGSDIGGSIRVPAAFCGIFGHRPSDSLIPRSGHFPGSTLPNPGTVLNVLGPLTRSAADLMLALDVVAGPDVDEDAAWRLALKAARHDRLRDFRVAILPIPDWAPVSEDVHRAIDSVRDALSAAGTTIDLAQPEGFGDLRHHHLLYTRLLATVFAFNAGQSDVQRRAEAEAMRATGDEIDDARARGLSASADEYLRDLRKREQYRQGYRDFFKRWDIVLAPIVPDAAFPHDDRPYLERTLDVDGREIPYSYLSIFPGVATLSGQPATAFPASFTADSMPVGLQAIGPYGEDRTPIRFAELVAKQLGSYRQPPGFD